MRADELKPLWDWAVRNGADPHQLATLWKEELWIGFLPAVVSRESNPSAPPVEEEGDADRVQSFGARDTAKDRAVAIWNAASLMGVDPVAVLDDHRRRIESGEDHLRRTLGDDARERMARFHEAADKYRRRYKEEKIALTFNETVTAFNLLPVSDADVELVAFSLYFKEVWEVVCKRRDLAKRYRISPEWERHCRYRVIAPLIGLALARGEEGEGLAKAQAELDWLKTQGADVRPRGKHDPIVRIGRDVLIGVALNAFSGCGLPVTSAVGECLAGALADATGIGKRSIVLTWERYPLRARHARNPDPEKPLIAPGVQCAKCGKAGKVPVYRAREGGGRLCTDCCEW